MPHHHEIAVNMIDIPGLSVCVREQVDRMKGRPLVLIHGNVSSSPFFFPLMARLPRHVRPIAVDLRGFGGTDTAPVDATRGLSDFADDVWATLDALGLDTVDLVGWSMGGGVVLQLILDQPDRVRTATLINPVSPYGVGATVDLWGHLSFPDAAGSGGGSANPDFVRSLASGEAGDAAETDARSVLRNFYVAPGWDGEDEDLYVTSMLSTATGDDNYPGAGLASSNWPGFAPGDRGVLNSLAPTHLDLSAIVDVQPQPPILWLRGSDDAIVSDTSAFDVARLGQLGTVPGYPGADLFPPQPMVAQTRAVLERYAAAGGETTEIVVAGTGHSPHIERPDAVAEALIKHLGA